MTIMMHPPYIPTEMMDKLDGLVVLCDVLQYCGVDDVMKMRCVSRQMDSFICSHNSMQWYWWIMIRRVAHRPRYAYDIDGCFTLRRIAIRRMRTCRPINKPICTIQKGRKLYGECINPRHLYKNVMKDAEDRGTTTSGLYSVWKTYMAKRVKRITSGL